jgi:hypothetical protein
MVKKPGTPIKASGRAFEFYSDLIRIARHLPVEQAFHCGKVKVVTLTLVTIVFIGGLYLLDYLLRNG